MNLENNTRFEITISIAVFASIAIMALETFSLPADLKEALFVADVTLSLMFVAEYVYRIVTAENKRAYVTSFYGIIDLVAIFPILVHATASVRVIRLLRVLRILRLLKIKRYSNALDRYRLGAEADCCRGNAIRRRGICLHYRFCLPDLRVRARSAAR